jgi:mRNA interferase RelE/StbE
MRPSPWPPDCQTSRPTVLDALATDPRRSRVVKLAGQNDYRLRVGDHRVVYAVDDDARMVIVARIVHRREVYRRG